MATSLHVNETLCRGCGVCAATCPRRAITIINNMATIDHKLCDGCGACAVACPTGALIEISDIIEERSLQTTPQSATPTGHRASPSAVAPRAQAIATAGAIAGLILRQILPRFLAQLASTPRPAQRPWPAAGFRKRLRFRGGHRAQAQ